MLQLTSLKIKLQILKLKKKKKTGTECLCLAILFLYGGQTWVLGADLEGQREAAVLLVKGSSDAHMLYLPTKGLRC